MLRPSFINRWVILCELAIFIGASLSSAQESIRTVDEPGSFSKYLTPGMVDRWIFTGKKDETIIAHVTTSEFDSCIQLVQTIDATEKVLREIDDDGSNSCLSFRLPEDGEYKILVRGYEGKGGGNYTLDLQQFRAGPIEIGTSTAGTYDGKGLAHFYFRGEPDQHVTINVQGNGFHQYLVLDPQGKQIDVWNELVFLSDGGEFVIRLAGEPSQRFELRIRPAKRLADSPKFSDSLASGEGAIVDIVGKTGDFRIIELESDQVLPSRLIFAQSVKEKARRIDVEAERPEIALLPIGSKGKFTRYAAIWGRNARFQLQLFSPKGATFHTISKSAATVGTNQTVNETLPVGDTRFFQLQLQAGQTITAQTKSSEFDPLLRLFNQFGREVRADDDGGGGNNCRLQYSAYAQETLLAAVASVGNGGGGEFDLGFTTEDAHQLDLNQKYARQVSAGATEQWLVDGKQGQTMIFKVNHRDSSPEVVLRNSSGVELISATSTRQAKGVVFAYEFPSDSTYSLWITIPAGGEYLLRMLDADQ